jgi:protease IV
MTKFSDYLKNIFFLLLILQFAPLFIQNIKKQYSRFFEPHTKVGYLPIKGVILNSGYYTHQLKKFFENKEIKAILLFVESPGGAAGSAEAIAHEIELLKKEHPKPIITLSENVLASGGYYIAATTDTIITLPSTLVGSIGVTIPGLFKLEDFIEQYKIHYNVIKAGEHKSVTDPFVNATPQQKELLQNVADSSYHNFIGHVAKHRSKLSVDSALTWADGKIFTGNQALENGLIDLIGSKSDAIKKIKETALIEGEIEWVKAEKPTSFWNIFSSPDYTDDHESLTTQLINTICVTLEERYGSVRGLKN